MSGDNLFAVEEEVITSGERLIADGRFGSADDKRHYQQLLKSYEKLFRATRRLMRLSDHNEQRLNAAAQVIAQKNKELKALSTKLSKYLSPQIYNSIFTGAQSVEIGSSRKKLTIFFSDVINFTETADKLESEELTNLLNHYLRRFSVVWGDPLPRRRMETLVRVTRLVELTLALYVFCGISVSRAKEAEPPPCTEDAMIVFDGSGSMYGDGWGYASTSRMSRIDNARSALTKVLPNITRSRRVGLITFGPGPYNQCNVKLELKPTPNAADRIMRIINALVPAGKTPLTSAVEQAANVLDFREKPGVIVVLTDGEETCGRSPCELGQELHAEAAKLTINVIGLRVKGFSWTGEQSMVETECLAEQNGGLYIAVETEDELASAFEKTLGCPMISQHTAVRTANQH
jgi:Ca-activated chloride channel family protein